MAKSSEQLRSERAKRIQDAYELKQPDRIPIVLNLGYMLARLGGISHAELESNPDKAQELLEEYALYYQPDKISGGAIPGKINRMLGDRMTRWPGYDLPDNQPFQFQEGEYMSEKEYDDFLNDPSDFAIRTFLPRAFSKLEGLAMLPPLATAVMGHGALPTIGVLNAPPVQTALKSLITAAESMLEAGDRPFKNVQRMAELGFPSGMDFAGIAAAPFDFIGDTLRAMRGSMMDMYRCPEKLLAAMEKSRKIILKSCIHSAEMTGGKVIMMPLHRGSDGFMSIKQFETFYWPQLKGLLLDMIDAGLIPSPFYEGIWDNRLHYLAELPKGKTRGSFEKTDMFKAKEIIGDTMCLTGGFPVSLLQAGTPEKVREHTRKMCEVVGKNGGFIMAASSAMDYCDRELVKVWVESTKEFGKY